MSAEEKLNIEIFIGEDEANKLLEKGHIATRKSFYRLDMLYGSPLDFTQ